MALFGRCAYYSIYLKIYQSTSFVWDATWRTSFAIPQCTTVYAGQDMCNFYTRIPNRCGANNPNGIIYRTVASQADVNVGLPGLRQFVMFSQVGSRGSVSSYTNNYISITGGSIYKISLGSGGTISEELSWHGKNGIGGNNFLGFHAQFAFSSACGFSYGFKLRPSTGYYLDRYSISGAPGASNGQFKPNHWSQQIKLFDWAISDPLISSGSQGSAWGNNITPCLGAC
jgi:hypothetical protein